MAWQNIIKPFDNATPLRFPEVTDPISKAVEYLKDAENIRMARARNKAERSRMRQEDEERRLQKELANSFRASRPKTAEEYLQRTAEFYAAKGKPEKAQTFQMQIEKLAADRAAREEQNTLKREQMQQRDAGRRDSVIRSILSNPATAMHLPEEYLASLGLTPMAAKTMRDAAVQFSIDKNPGGFEANIMRAIQANPNDPGASALLESIMRVRDQFVQQNAQAGYMWRPQNPFATSLGFMQTQPPALGGGVQPMMAPTTESMPMGAGVEPEPMGPGAIEIPTVNLAPVGGQPLTAPTPGVEGTPMVDLAAAAKAAGILQPPARAAGKTEKQEKEVDLKFLQNQLKNDIVIKEAEKAKVNTSELQSLVDKNKNLQGINLNANQLTIIFKYIKALDNTAVRESEVARLQSLYGNTPQAWRERLNLWISGAPISRDVADAILKSSLSSTERLFAEANKRIANVIARAMKSGVRPQDLVSQDVFQEAISRPDWKDIVSYQSQDYTFENLPGPALASEPAAITPVPVQSRAQSIVDRLKGVK